MEQARLNGSIIGALFSGVWFILAAQVVHGDVHALILYGGLFVALVTAYTAIRRKRALEKTDQQYSLFKMRSYRIIVGLELLAIGAGTGLLRHANQGLGATAAYIALVVGLHFIGLGYFAKTRTFSIVGVAMIIVALVATAGIGYGWSNTLATLVAALASACILLTSSWFGIRSTHRSVSGHVLNDVRAVD